MLEVVTPDEYMYETVWKSVKNRDSFTFQVKACGDAHVILSNEIGQTDSDIFEFSIGGWNNTLSVLRSAVRVALKTPRCLTPVRTESSFF